MIPVFVLGIFQVPQLVAQSVNPLLASILSLGIIGIFILIIPFFQAGIIGMADEALTNQTRLDTFVADGKTHYIPVLVAYLLLLVINSIIGGILLLAAFIVGIFVLPHVELSGFALGFLGLFFLVFIAVFLLLIFFFQFYVQAIVLDDHGAIAGIKHSIGIVRRNLVSTLGYSIIGGVIVGGLGLILGAMSILLTPQLVPSFGLPGIIALSLLIVLIGTIIWSFFAIYSVSFYRDISHLSATPA